MLANARRRPGPAPQPRPMPGKGHTPAQARALVPAAAGGVPAGTMRPVAEPAPVAGRNPAMPVRFTDWAAI